MTGKTSMKASSEKPQVDKILKYDCMIHKSDVKILEDKIQYSCLAKINIIYKCEETKELVTLEDDVFISGEDEAVGVNSDMKANYKNFLKSFDVRLNQDDLGENRIIDVDIALKIQY